ncbi:hypothetical protein BOTBODRAFT_180516 [Botryobasidium botryosum FD-172 SS1]|uniref:Carrier domain-containing protein n=1 Tax=Botryobasidium botryosum (strain FD-172 SS1) TaxID=930990 RepID=A0A067M6Y6_BOTB1|nr:hypothetical protein BOTBODRAFT_180516 [Botryobasidium botryosum FD-172 SS1]
MSLPLPSTPTSQAVGSQTFTPPPIDGSACFSQMIDHHLVHSPTHPLFRYKSTKSEGSPFEELLWSDVGRAVHRAARLINSRVGSLLPGADLKPVVAILSSADAPTYFAMAHGIGRAGYTAFLLSVRNSPAGMAHLLFETNTTHLFIGNDRANRELARAAQDTLLESHPKYHLETLEFPVFGDLYKNDDAHFEALPAMQTPDLDSITMILHSSGSTAFPKPIRITHRTWIQWTRTTGYGDFDLCGEVIGLLGMPFFHAYAAIVSANACANGSICAVLSPYGDSFTAPPETLVAEIISTQCSFVFTVPSNIEAWSRDPHAVAALTKLRGLLFGGAPLNEEVGESLSEKGVPLSAVYGCTETGCLTKFMPARSQANEWNYFEFPPQMGGIMKPREEDPGTYELYAETTPTLTPAVFNAEIEGIPVYETKDIFIVHPRNPKLFKILGRADDQIMLSTGEKTNPGPMEMIIKSDPMVKEAVMFGRGRFQNGVLIEPAEGHQIDPADLEALSSFRNAIWKSVERANAYGPSHSRIFKEMIVVSAPSKPFLYTPKGSVKRQVIVKMYETEIDAAYEAVEDASQTNIEPPTTWDYPNVRDFIEKVVSSVLGRGLADDDDIFQYGADSLQATTIRNAILRALRQDNISVTNISQSFVYSSPTISGLAKFVSSLGDSASQDIDSYNEARKQRLEEMVAKYTTNFPLHRPTGPAPKTEVAMLTGSTGGVGSAVLAHLVALPSFSRIYAFNRKSRDGVSVKQRQLEALEDRGLDTSIVNSDKVIFVEGDTTAEDLGISPELYSEIRDSVTCIIHNAWRVDFALSLSSFEPLIKGTRNLVDLALMSPHPTPARVLFTSSVSVVMNWTAPTPVPEDTLEDTTAIVMGYGESKWVSERILQIAGEVTALRPVVVRLGQMSGGENGSWNQSEWLPCIVRSGEVLGVLPTTDGSISWLPLSAAATAIVEMRNSPYTTLHLCHPRPVPWSSIFEHIAASIGAKTVPFPEWFSRLEGSVDAGSEVQVEQIKENPALMLLETYRAFASGVGPDLPFRDATGSPMLETSKAVEVAPSLREDKLGRLGKDDADRWLAYWRKTGFLQTV